MRIRHVCFTTSLGSIPVHIKTDASLQISIPVWQSMWGAQPHTRDTVAEQCKQIGVALRLHSIVALVRGGRQREWHPVRVQVPQQPLSTCATQQELLSACVKQCERRECTHTWVSSTC